MWMKEKHLSFVLSKTKAEISLLWVSKLVIFDLNIWRSWSCIRINHIYTQSYLGLRQRGPRKLFDIHSVPQDGRWWEDKSHTENLKKKIVLHLVNKEPTAMVCMFHFVLYIMQCWTLSGLWSWLGLVSVLIHSLSLIMIWSCRALV